MLAEHSRGDPVGLIHLPLGGLRGDDGDAGRFHRLLEAQLALLTVEGGSDPFEQAHLVALLQSGGQILSHFAGARAIVRAHKRNLDPLIGTAPGRRACCRC